MAHRLRSLCVGLLGLLLAAAGPTAADTIWFDPEKVGDGDAGAQANKETIEGHPGVRLYQQIGGGRHYYLRGRVVALETDEAPATPEDPVLYVQTWSRSGSAIRWNPTPIGINWSWIKHVDNEFDARLDLQLLLSGSEPFRGVVGSPAWKAHVRDLLPDVGLVEEDVAMGSDADDPWDRGHDSAELSPSDPRDFPGSVVFHLGGLGPSPEEWSNMGQPELAARWQETLKAPFHPVHHTLDAGQIVRGLLEGLARYERYYKDDPHFHLHYAGDPEGMGGPPPRGLFAREARVVIALFCAFAKVEAPLHEDISDPYGSGYRSADAIKRRFRDFGLASRDVFFGVLREAAPGNLVASDLVAPRELGVPSAPGDPSAGVARHERLMTGISAVDDVATREALLRRYAEPEMTHHSPLVPAARLHVDPSEVALQALDVMRNAPTWWVLHGGPTGEDGAGDPLHEAERVVGGLVDLMRRPQDHGGSPLPDPRAADRHFHQVQLEARLTLMLLLRPPKMAERTTPDRGWALDPFEDPRFARAIEGDPGPPPVKGSSDHFREALGEFFLSADPGTRDAIQRLLIEFGEGDPFATLGVVDRLFATASGGSSSATPGAPPSAPEEDDDGWGSTPILDTGDTLGEELSGDRARELAAARRRYALSTLMLLGALDEGDPDDEVETVGERVRDRFAGLMLAVEEDEANEGERELVRMLHWLYESESGGSDHARMVDLAHLIDAEIWTELDSGMEYLRSVASGDEPRATTEELKALRDRLEALKGVRDHLRGRMGVE